MAELDGDEQDKTWPRMSGRGDPVRRVVARRRHQPCARVAGDAVPWPPVGGDGRVATDTGGTQVLFDGVPAPILYTSAGQLAAVVPYAVDGKTGTQVQVRNGSAPTVAAIKEHLHGQLAGYKMPRGVVQVDKIVRSPSGKPDYRWAKETALAGLDA